MNPNSNTSEAYRMISANLQYILKENKYKSFLVTSSTDREDVSELAGNLAVDLAQEGYKVVLIDCNYRESILPDVFGIESKTGLSDVILKNKKIDEVVEKIPIIDNLDIITCGNKKELPSRVIANYKMEALIEEIKQAYDYVIMTSPPILKSPETIKIASIIEGVVLVIGQNKSRQHDVDKAIEMLNNVDSNILGTVFTKSSRFTLPFKLFK